MGIPPLLVPLALGWYALVAALAGPRVADALASASRSFRAGPWQFSLPTLAANLREVAASIGLAAVLVLAVWLAGAALLGWLNAGRRRELFAAAAFPAGCGAAAAGLGGLLLVRLWYVPLLVAAVAVPALLAAPAGLPRLRAAARRIGRPGPWGLLALASFALMLPWLVAPETHTDAWWHFLAAPRRWLAAHGFTIANASGPMHLPPIAESLNVFAVLSGLDAVPRMLDTTAGLCGVAATMAVVAPASPGWTWLLFGLCAGSPILLFGKNDGLAFGCILAAWSFGRRAPLAAGALFGIGACVKPTALVHGAWLLPLLLAGGGRRVPRAAGWLAAATLAAGPWYLKEYLLTGDPVFPVLSGWFPGLVDGWDARNAAVWRLVTHIPPAGIARPAEVALELIGILLPLVWLLPLWLLSPRPYRRDAALALAVFALWHLGMHNPHTTRHAFAVVALCIVLVGSDGPGATALPRVLTVLLLVPAFLLRLGWACTGPNPVPFALGAETRAAFIARAFTTLDGLRRGAAAVPVPGRVTLLVGDPHEYAVAPPVIVGNGEASGATPLLWALTHASADEAGLAKRFRQLAVGRIAYNPVRGLYNAGFYTPFAWDDRQLALWRSFFGRRFEIEWVSPTADDLHGAFCVYRLRRSPRAMPGLLLHLPGTEGPAEESVELLNRGRAAEAIAVLRAHLARTGPVAEYLASLGFAARTAGDFELAWRSYRPGFDAGLVNDENAFGFGVAALRTGRLDEAERGFERACALYPTAAAEARTALALVRLRLALLALRKSPAAAALVIERALAGAADPPPPPEVAKLVPILHAALAVARIGQGRIADGVAERDRAAAALPEVRRMTADEIHAELWGFQEEMCARIGPPEPRGMPLP